jgi:hypothetical protein
MARSRRPHEHSRNFFPSRRFVGRPCGGHLYASNAAGDRPGARASEDPLPWLSAAAQERAVLARQYETLLLPAGGHPMTSSSRTVVRASEQARPSPLAGAGGTAGLAHDPRVCSSSTRTPSRSDEADTGPAGAEDQRLGDPTCQGRDTAAGARADGWPWRRQPAARRSPHRRRGT